MADPKKTATRARRSPKAGPKGAGASVVAPAKGAAPAGAAAKRAPKAAAKAAATPPTLAARVQEVVETTREAPAQLALPVAPAVETPAAAAMKAIEGAVEAAKPLDAAVPSPVAAAVETVRTVLGAAAPKADEIVTPAARLVESAAERARSAYARARASGDHLRQAMSETAVASTRGALEVNGKVIDALVAQSDAAFDVWRRSLAAGSIAEAMRLQTSGAREVYETASSHWRDVAETATRWLGSTIRPIQAAAEQTRRG